jgi:serine/threonine protein phosphatase 1
MPGRTIAIGDIHGCSDALAVLIEVIKPGREDTIITLGDYIDRGPNSREVLDLIIALSKICRLVSLLGDHEEMLSDAIRDTAAQARWLRCGGVETLRSYGWAKGGPKRRLGDWVPDHHKSFIGACRPFLETSTHLFMHAGYQAELPMNKQLRQALLWRVTDARMAVPHFSGKVAVVGHTAQLTGEVLDLGFLICIDTNCARGGCLTALDIGSGDQWQVDITGKFRNSNVSAPTRRGC